MKQGKYRILCTIDGTFCVQERVADGGWMEIHRCESKNEAGLNEARKWIDEIQETMIVDEILCYHGQMTSAYGHTDDLLIYWDKKGRSWIAKRDKTRQFINMHDELFSATYERNDIFDLTTAEIIENHKNNAHSN